jgi:hypothetical protein
MKNDRVHLATLVQVFPGSTSAEFRFSFYERREDRLRVLDSADGVRKGYKLNNMSVVWCMFVQRWQARDQYKQHGRVLTGCIEQYWDSPYYTDVQGGLEEFELYTRTLRQLNSAIAQEYKKQQRAHGEGFAAFTMAIMKELQLVGGIVTTNTSVQEWVSIGTDGDAFTFLPPDELFQELTIECALQQARLMENVTKTIIGRF